MTIETRKPETKGSYNMSYREYREVIENKEAYEEYIEREHQKEIEREKCYEEGYEGDEEYYTFF